MKNSHYFGVYIVVELVASGIFGDPFTYLADRIVVDDCLSKANDLLKLRQDIIASRLFSLVFRDQDVAGTKLCWFGLVNNWVVFEGRSDLVGDTYSSLVITTTVRNPIFILVYATPKQTPF